MTSQWERLLKNTGKWVGSFTQLSPQGDVLSDIPTVVALTPQDADGSMRQEIIKYPPGEAPQETVLQYRSLARSILFFENGAFAQGSIQWGPFSDFGAELGLIANNHRLRIVQLFDKIQQLKQITLIREHLEGTAPSQREALTPESLVGIWQGEAVTLYPDLRPSDTYKTVLRIVCRDSTLLQELSWGNQTPPIRSQGKIVGDRRILFTTGSQTVQVLLLPDGASSTCPIHITPRQPLFLEIGWMVTPNLRQRMIRQYTAQGGWANLTLVTETKIS